jgi:hypothetical protein
VAPGDDESEAVALEKGEKKREIVDLTHMQTEESGAKGGMEEMDEFDLLDATIDPMDLPTLEKVAKIETDIKLEKSFIAIRYAYRYSQDEEDPMKISI